MLIADYIHEVSSGILIAIGRQKIAIIVNLCGYWLIGIPLAVIGYISSEEDNEIKVKQLLYQDIFLLLHNFIFFP